LQQILKGSLVTSSGEEALVPLVLKGLVENLTPKRQPLLISVLTQPGTFRNDQGQLTAETLQQQAIAAVEAQQLPQLREQLAGQLANIPPQSKKPIVDMLLQQRFDNLQAQVAMFMSTAVDATTKDRLQLSFAVFSRSAMNKLLGIKTPAPANNEQGGYGGQDGSFVPPGAAGGFGGGAGAAAGLGDEPGGPQGGRPPGAPGGFAPPGAGAGFGPPGAAGGGQGDAASGDAAALAASATQVLDLTDEQAQQVVKILWDEKLVSQVGSRLEKSKSLRRAVTGVALGATLPLSEVRKAFHELIQANYLEGTKDLQRAKAFDLLASDPGLLLVVKRAPRIDRPAPRVRSSEEAGGGFAGYPGSPAGFQAGGPDDPNPRPGGRPANPAIEKQQKEREAKMEWMDASEDLSLAFMKRFRAAGSTSDEGDSLELPGDFPVKLHKDATVVAHHRVKWPEEVPGMGSVSGLPPLTVYYARIEQDARFSNLNTHYSHQGPSPKRHALLDGFWYDSLGKTPNGTIRSIDIRVTLAPAGREEEGNQFGGGAGGPPRGGPAGVGGPQGGPGGFPGAGGGNPGAPFVFRPPLTETAMLVEILVVEIPEYDINGKNAAANAGGNG
jgi:hypothetical protein